MPHREEREAAIMTVLAKGRPGWGRSQFQRKAKNTGPLFVLILSLQTALLLNVSLLRDYRELLLCNDFEVLNN
jgi:hypothetical protein